MAKHNPHKEYSILPYHFTVRHKDLEIDVGRTLSDEEGQLLADHIADGLHTLVADYMGELVANAIEETGLGDD